MGITRRKMRAGQIAYFDGATYETVLPLAPRRQFEDFEGVTYDTLKWLYCDAGAATEALDGVGNCILSLTAGGAGETQEAGISNQGNVLNWDISKGLIIEFRINVSTLPTLLSELHIGVLGEAIVADDQIAEADDLDEHAVFVLDGSGAILIYSDDGTNERDAIATGVTAVPGTYLVFRIDFTDDAKVLFNINGPGVAAGTTFAMDDIASPLVQPVVRLTKSGGQGLGVVAVDYIKIWQATR